MITREPCGVSLHQVGKSYRGRNGTVEALINLSFRVLPGEFVCVVGPSGCGKSTLLKLLAGLDHPSGGTITYEQDIGSPHSALVFQENSLFPWMTLLDNVAFGLEAQGLSKTERLHRSREFLEQIGLGAFSHHFPHELSGGMQQRGAIARAILTNPYFLLMDEPFSALDAQSKLLLQEELLRLWHLQQQTVIYVTHDIEEAILLGDRILVMSGQPGRIRENLTVPLDRPRDLKDSDHPVVREMKWRIWKTIEEEVRQILHLSP